MNTKKQIQYLSLSLSVVLCAVSYGQSVSTANISTTNYTTVDRYVSAGGTSSFRDAVCYDGLGFPAQEISYSATRSGKAIVRPIVYDSMRRDDAVTYLPFSESLSKGNYVMNAVDRQRIFYQSLHNDGFGYIEKEYEPSPVGRVISEMNAGKEYRSANRKSAMFYSGNTSTDAVPRFTYAYPTEDISSGAIISRGLYPANALEKVTSTDEDGNKMESFTDGRGLLVCTRRYLSGNSMLETRYVYDLKDSLVCVMQPEGVRRLGTTESSNRLNFSDGIAKDYCFLYRYDGLGRVIQSQVPGGGVTEFVYDERGRVVAISSPEMKKNGLYKITEYNVLDRVTNEAYVKFGNGVTAESIRTAASGGRGLPAYTVVRSTYKAKYYSGNDSGTSSPSRSAHLADGEIVFDVTAQISSASQSRMVLGEVEEEVLVSSAEYLYVPDERDVDDVTAVPKEDFIPDATATSTGARRLRMILATESALKFTPDEMASASDRDESFLRGLLKEETISSVPGADGTVISADTLTKVRRYYYDYRGNVIQIKELDSDGWAGCYSTKYDFAGNVTGTLESHTSPADKTTTVKSLFTLDQRGNVLSEDLYTDGVLLTRTDYSYDELMRLTGKTTGQISETISYDIRGWQTGHIAAKGQERIYSETLRYMTPASGNSTPHWTGLISEEVTQHYGTSARSDSFIYDAVGRLTSSGRETGICYDANGNVTALRRISDSGNVTADLTMTYAGNRLARVTNTGSEDRGTFAYAYDSSGNLTSDTRNRLEICNNVLNLPMRVEQGGTMGDTMTYTYLGDGTKAAARVGAADAGKRYRGSYVYDVTAAGVQSLESVAVSTGRLVALTGTNGALSFEHDGFITDHLGNVAAVVNLSASPGTSTQNLILEQNDYTPFGTRIEPAAKTQAANRWRYAGKEEQRIAGMDLHLIDFGARYYDPFTCRWNATDPLAHKYFSMSPYNYCGNDPVNYFDAKGDSLSVKEVATIEAIYHGIMPGINVKLKFDNGVLDPNSIPGHSGDFFLDDLKEIASDKRMVYLDLAPSYICRENNTGMMVIRSFVEPIDTDDNSIPGAVEIAKNLGLPYGRSISGNLGRSLFPVSTESVSMDGTIHMIINSKGSLNHQTVGIVHELGHILLFLKGLPYQHPEADSIIYEKSTKMSIRLGYDY